jgi:tRNA1(Val) A37 N6-methylase TrmN6
MIVPKIRIEFQKMERYASLEGGGMFLYQPASGYRYNSDSLFLYGFIRRFSPRGRVLDIGCGVGILALLLARDFPVRICAVDKQSSMLAYASRNFAVNGMEAEIIEGDFLETEFEGRFDFIVSNPPFYDPAVTQSRNEHINAARYAHHLPPEALIPKVKRILCPKGHFVFCYDARQIDQIMHLLKTSGLNPETLRFVHSKADREAKIFMLSARIDSRSKCRVLPPLIVFDEKGHYCPEASEIFDIAATWTVRAEYKNGC